MAPWEFRSKATSNGFRVSLWLVFKGGACLSLSFTFALKKYQKAVSDDVSIVLEIYLTQKSMPLRTY